MRLKPFLPLVVLAMLLTACQTDFHGDDIAATNDRSLKIKDAKAFFEENRPTTTRTQGNVMSLGISEKCSPDWSKAKESENEHLYCVEVPLKSGFKFISTRKRKLGGKEIYLHQDVLRKLVVLKKKETNEIFMGVMSLVPKVYFTNGEPSTSYDFNHFGDKCGYAGLVIYTNPAGTLVATDFYLKGERILHHHLSKDNPRMDIAKKIIGPVQIYAFESETRGGTEGVVWYCAICDMYHHYDDELPPNCFSVIVDICQGCMREVRYCMCGPDETCPSCGQDPCNCYYDSCPICGQNASYCICGNGCPDCGDPYCTTDHNAENENPTNIPLYGREHLLCEDTTINNIIDNFLDTNIGQIIFRKIDIETRVEINQNHKGVRFLYSRQGECLISIGNQALPLDLVTGLKEELVHLSQFCEHGYDVYNSAKLNFEVEAKCMVALECCVANGIYDPSLMGSGYCDEIHNLAMYYFYFGYEDSGNRNFDSEYNKVVEHYRNSPYSSYAEENTYPENSDYRNFNTFHEDYQKQ